MSRYNPGAVALLCWLYETTSVASWLGWLLLRSSQGRPKPTPGRGQPSPYSTKTVVEKEKKINLFSFLFLGRDIFPASDNWPCPQ